MRMTPDANAEGQTPTQQAGEACEVKDSLPTVEVNDALVFLKRFRPGGPWVLTAIIPDGRTTTSTFREDQMDLLRRWIAGRTGRENIYFQVNATGDRNITKKTTKADIARAEIDTGRRFAPTGIRRFCEEFSIPADPILRALGWGPGDADMRFKPVTMAAEDPSCTAGTALCEIANDSAHSA